MRHEHRAYEGVINSLAAQSLKTGFKNIAVVRRPDVLIRLLIEEGILPEDSDLGRQRFHDMGYLQRTALSAPIAFLEERQEQIKEWVEDNTEHTAEDVYNVLRAGAVIGASLGYVRTASPVLNTFYSRIRSLPDTGSKTKILRNKESIINLISAD